MATEVHNFLGLKSASALWHGERRREGGVSWLDVCRILRELVLSLILNSHGACFWLISHSSLDATPPQQLQWFPPRELTRRRNRLTKALLILWIVSLQTKSKRGLACRNFSHSLSTEVSKLTRTFCVWPCVFIVVAILILVDLEEGIWDTRLFLN